MKLGIEDWQIDQVESTEISQAIIAAIDNQDKAALITLFNGSADVNGKITVAESTMTPLMYASGMGTPEMVQFMLQRGALVNDVDIQGCGALDIALEKGKQQNVAMLLKYHANCEYFFEGSSRSESYLKKFAGTTNAQCFKVLFDHVCELNEGRLLYFIYKIAESAICHPENFAIILEKIDSDDTLNQLLKFAINKDSGEVCTQLLNKIVNLDDAVVIKYQEHNGYEYQKTYPLLIHAIKNGHCHAVKALYESGRVDINALCAVVEKKYSKTTEVSVLPLIEAIKSEQPAVVEFLCSLPDIEVNKRPTKVYGDTPIRVAQKKALSGSPDMLIVLLLHDDIDLSPLHSHEEYKNKKDIICRLLSSRRLLTDAYKKCHEVSASEFKTAIMQSYAYCPLVIYYRVMSFITRYEKKQIDLSKSDRALVDALLNFNVTDDHFKAIALSLGRFIYLHKDLFARNFEYALLFLQHVLAEDPEAKKLVVSSLYQLVDAKKDIPRDGCSINDLLTDAQLRPQTLSALAKANCLRYSLMSAKPPVTQEDVLLNYRANPEPLSLMWNIVRWYGSEHTMDVESEATHVATIVQWFEGFMLVQDKDLVEEQGKNTAEGSALARSLSGLLSATTSEPALDDKSSLLTI